MEVTFNENNSELTLFIDKTIYNLQVLHKCFYWYSNRFDIDIGEEDKYYTVCIGKIPENIMPEKLLSDIKKDLIDFKTRDIISKETADIRLLLIAKAFANGEEFDARPPGDLDDPVGFDVFDLK